MTKEELIEHLKSFLPSNYNFAVQNKNNYLVYIKKKIFGNDILIHPVFLKADKNQLKDIIGFITAKDKTELKNIKIRLSDFFNKNHKHKISKVKLKYKNKNILEFFLNTVNDLKNKYNKMDFSKVKISWGRSVKNRRRSIRFGSFDKKRNLIRLHPALDNILVPDFFIYSVIYHEAAHFIIFSENPSARSHGIYFNKLLKSIDPFYEQSRKWERENKKFFFDGIF